MGGFLFNHETQTLFEQAPPQFLPRQKLGRNKEEIMAWGQSEQLEGAGLCHVCLQPKTGAKIGTVGGTGFGSQRKEGTVAVCVNHDCLEGRKNLAEQKKTG